MSLLLRDPDGGRRTVFGGANRPVNRELRQFRSNADLLERVAEITGGRVLDPAQPAAAEAGLFSREGYDFVTRSVRPLWRTLLMVLLGLVLLDVANRRIAWDPVGVWRWGVARLDAALGILTLRNRGEAQADTMGSLKAARRRATARYGASQPEAGAKTGEKAGANRRVLRFVLGVERGSGVGARSGRRVLRQGQALREVRGRPPTPSPAATSPPASAALPKPTPSASASRKPPRIAATPDDDAEATTTSRLMAAKRAARDRMSDEQA